MNKCCLKRLYCFTLAVLLYAFNTSLLSGDDEYYSPDEVARVFLKGMEEKDWKLLPALMHSDWLKYFDKDMIWMFKQPEGEEKEKLDEWLYFMDMEDLFERNDHDRYEAWFEMYFLYRETHLKNVTYKVLTQTAVSREVTYVMYIEVGHDIMLGRDSLFQTFAIHTPYLLEMELEDGKWKVSNLRTPFNIKEQIQKNLTKYEHIVFDVERKIACADYCENSSGGGSYYIMPQYEMSALGAGSYFMDRELRYEFVRDNYGDLPSWDWTKENEPPLTLKDAIKQGMVWLKSYFPDYNDWYFLKFELVVISVPKHEYFYKLHYGLEDMKSEYFEMWMLMDGTVIDPIWPDGRPGNESSKI